jgi:putative nucleotidyltransferase with HDIG domain
MNSGVPSKHESPTGDSLAVNRRPIVRSELRSASPVRNLTSGPAGERRGHTGHRGRLLLAFEALETFPALVESRDRLLSVTAKDHPMTADVIAAVESDVALVIAVLRLANHRQPARRCIDTVAGAVALLGPRAIRALASHARTFDFFGRTGMWDSVAQRFRLHALATQRAADRIAAQAGYEDRERLAVTSLLHDVGKLVLIHAHVDYASLVHHGTSTPEERIQQERRELGIEHALVGSALVRRWRLPDSLATPIERHHSPDGGSEAAIIQLADMLAHYEQGARVSPSAMLRSARSIGLSSEQLRRVMNEPPPSSQRQRPVDPSPLTSRELAVLQQLAKGSVYKQIAHDLTLTTSTIRSHLHNTYGKLGVGDRAQAVLVASQRGWL